ncbi:MAG: bifunctional folylpolyglutamate synthase/dihydrofolate synthase [Acidobacteriales bacterium]|nr:bifunctional folylpolyglutamate synthase/dihydrofolate synthase [Terriglobales bacterium]
MSYEAAVAHIYALGYELADTPSRKFDLAYMRVLLHAMGNPERRFRNVLIAGTNGKGSTAATLASILKASRLRSGLYTSPHLVRVNERIRVNGTEIGDEDFASLYATTERIAEHLVGSGKLPWHPSFFEMLTAIAFQFFSQQNLDLAVLEVGMGGRLDATNVVEPILSVITDISLDHEKFLGETVGAIAREKAGIMRPGGVVVTLPQQPEANDVIGNTALELDASVVSAVPYVPPVSPASPSYFAGAARDCVSRYPLYVMGSEIVVETPLVGRHQLRNVGLAIAAAVELANEGFAITPDSIARGIRETRWPGRFEMVAATKEHPEYVFDVAHNPAGAWALRSTLSARYPDRRLIFIFGAMRDKAIPQMTEILFPLAERVIVTVANNPRSATTDEIRGAAIRTSVEIILSGDVPSALEAAQKFAGADGVIVITGSIYIVGKAMNALGLRI